MAARKQMMRFKCSHEGCTEYAHYEADNRAHAFELERRYGRGQWRCVRHSQPEDVLSTERRQIVREIAVTPINAGLYWGKGSSFAHGPGFKAFAEDFPIGTVLRITAEIVLPDPTPSLRATEAGNGTI